MPPRDFRYGRGCVQSDLDLSELAPADAASTQGRPTLRLLEGVVEPVDRWIRDWTGAEGEVIRRLGQNDRGLVLAVGSHFQYQLHADGASVTWSSSLPKGDCARILVHEVVPASFARQGHCIVHASAFDYRDGVIGIAGYSGAGKSTLAAAMAGGLPGVYSDDTLWIDTEELRCWPGFVGSWLTPSALGAVSGLPKSGAPKPDEERVFIEGSREAQSPKSLLGMIHIVESEDGEEALFEASPLPETALLFTLLSHWMHPNPSESHAAFVTQTTELVNRIMGLQVKLPDSLASLPACVQEITRSLQEPGRSYRARYDARENRLNPC